MKHKDSYSIIIKDSSLYIYLYERIISLKESLLEIIIDEQLFIFKGIHFHLIRMMDNELLISGKVLEMSIHE